MSEGESRAEKSYGNLNLLKYATGEAGFVQYKNHVPVVYTKFLELLRQDGQSYPPTEEWIVTKMEAEWSAPELRLHWDYVLSDVPVEPEKRIWDGDVRDNGHEGYSVDEFWNKPQARKAKLDRNDIISIRLYTGPGYRALNGSLRSESYSLVVTCWCLTRAVGRIARVTPVQFLVRGMKGKLPEQWTNGYNRLSKFFQQRGLVISDPAFVSTTTDLKVATSNFDGNIIFVVKSELPMGPNAVAFDESEQSAPESGYLRNGGDVSWISQYPVESEVLLPINVELIPLMTSQRHPEMFEGVKKEIYEFSPVYQWNFKDNCPKMPEED
eukprot:NODE_4757_length_1118_cov_70.621106_g4221_i0.p1 GENE.NODE_4757_length_1118_cov_70.621106_g4221_i0~~NODE_4757_length_1118_cov_70.621106_g4221_i0.p1  ORF type:complete len:325 (+),score=62.86 NODE_4757_length_1118_cov_70.621106_g4221_i0:56-1030(+)